MSNQNTEKPSMANDDLYRAVMETTLEQLPTHLHPYITEINDFRFGLIDESDRAAALMAAAFLEDYLGRLMSKYMVNDPRANDQIFSNNGPLGTFSAKIDMGYMLGLLSATTRKDLHLLRKIRNDFAHSAKALKFTEHSIQSRCYEFSSKAHLPPSSEPRLIFNRTMTVISQDIALTMSNLEHKTEKAHNNFSGNGKKAFLEIINTLKETGMDLDSIEAIVRSYP